METITIRAGDLKSKDVFLIAGNYAIVIATKHIGDWVAVELMMNRSVINGSFVVAIDLPVQIIVPPK